MVFMMLVLLAVIPTGMVDVLAENDKEYSISNYEVSVHINYDGSLDITEDIDFTFYGGFNDIMIPISKNEGEEIEITNVYMMKKTGYIECKKLLAGQWDAEVFSGTYSVIDEENLVKLKVYGSFSKTYGSIIVHYKVKNAIKRYQDIAEYRRTHILKSLETKISQINISVYLPGATDKSSVIPYLHGVFVGNKRVYDRRTVTYHVPDTVPGEYIEARIIFPQELVDDCPVTEDAAYLEQVKQEELEYDESDKADLLKAREMFARKAGQKAFNDRLLQRVKTISMVFSIIASALGIYYIFYVGRRLRSGKKIPVPETLKEIDYLNPAEVRLMMYNGKLGARALLGKIFELLSGGWLTHEIINEPKPRLVFHANPDKTREGLDLADQYLMGWIADYDTDKTGFDPYALLKMTAESQRAENLKSLVDEWFKRITIGFDRKNIIGSSIVNLRNWGIVGGALLLFLGCVIPIAMSIWAGYLMIPVGLMVLLYALGIRRHTDFGISQHRIWKTLKERLVRNDISLEQLPDWMVSCQAFMGYAIALGVEKTLVAQIAENKEDQSPLICRLAGNCTDQQAKLQIGKVLHNTLTFLDQSISSVQDVV